MTNHTRRGLLRGAGALFLCAPAIVRASSLDAIRGVPMGLDEAWRPAEEMFVEMTLYGYDEHGLSRTEWFDIHGLSRTEWFDIDGGLIREVYRDFRSVANGQHS